MSPTLKLVSECLNEGAVFIENKDCRMVLLGMISLMNDIKPVIAVDRDIVRNLESVFIRKRHPVRQELVLVLPFSKNNATASCWRFLAGSNQIHAAEGGQRRRAQKFASGRGDRIIHAPKKYAKSRHHVNGRIKSRKSRATSNFREYPIDHFFSGEVRTVDDDSPFRDYEGRSFTAGVNSIALGNTVDNTLCSAALLADFR